ncbi:MAG TPA: hypothetical protein VFZ73_11450 [Gemmatimonadaceae bacterium]
MRRITADRLDLFSTAAARLVAEGFREQQGTIREHSPHQRASASGQFEA